MNINVNSEQLTMLTMSVELMLGMEMYDIQDDEDMHDFGLTYEGLETVRDILYQVKDAQDTTDDQGKKGNEMTAPKNWNKDNVDTTDVHEHPYPHHATKSTEPCWCGYYEKPEPVVSLIDQSWTADEIGHLIRSVQLNYESDFSMTLMKLRELIRDDEFAYGTEFVMTNDPDTMDRVAKL